MRARVVRRACPPQYLSRLREYQPVSFFSLSLTSTMSDTSEELFLEDESDATHGSDCFGAAVSAHTWLDGAALGLSSHGDDHTGAVYPFPEDDYYGINSCYRVLQACPRRPGAVVRCGSISVLPDAKWQAACALRRSNGSLARGQPGRLLQRGARRLRGIGCATELVAADRVGAALRDAGGAVGELTALRPERKALLTTLAAVATATGGTQVEPKLCTTSFAEGVCAHAQCRFLRVRRV